MTRIHQPLIHNSCLRLLCTGRRATHNESGPAAHVTQKMGLLKQILTLTNKNLLIIVRRHAVATLVRAFLLPVAFFIFLTFARNLFVSNHTFGVGSGQPVRTLQQGLEAADAGRKHLLFVNNGYRYVRLFSCRICC